MDDQKLAVPTSRADLRRRRDEVLRRARALGDSLDLTRADDWRESAAAVTAEAVEIGVHLPNPYAPNAGDLRAALAERPELLVALRPALARVAEQRAAIRWNAVRWNRAARTHCIRLPRPGHAARRGVRRTTRRARAHRARAPGPRKPADPEPRRRYPRPRAAA